MTDKTRENDHSEAMHSDQYNSIELISVGVTIALAYVITSPPVYRYGVSNHNEQLPLVKHSMDPNYLANDWVVSVKTGFGTPRYYYTQMVGTVSEVIGLPITVFSLYVFFFIISVIGVYILISDIFNDRLVATVTVGLILAHGATLPGVIPFPPDLGGNSLISNYLIPSHIANALILISLVYAVRQKYRHSFSILGVATLFHVVNGFWIAVTVGLCAVVVETGSEFQNENFRLGMKNIPWSGGVIYSAISSFVILPLLATNLSAESEFEVAYIIAWVRHPHHYILSTWSVPSIATTVAFIITGFLIIYYFRDIIFNSNDKRAFACTYVVSITSIMFVGGYVLTEVVPIGAIIKLQPFHIDDFLYVILYAGIAKVAVVALHRVANQTTINYNTLSIGIVLISVIIATVTWTIPLIMMQMGSSMFVENHYQGIGGDQSISEIYPNSTAC